MTPRFSGRVALVEVDRRAGEGTRATITVSRTCGPSITRSTRSDAWASPRALAAASSASPDAFDGRFPGLTLASFVPSLHLDLAASHEAVGHLDRAREPLAHASAATHALGDGDLARTTRGAIERMLARLGPPA